MSARQLRGLIAGLNKAGTTIFLTTHYIEEAERLCDRIAFLVQGGIVRVDSVADLLQPVQDKHRLQITCTLRPGVTEQLFSAFPHLEMENPGPDRLLVTSDEPVRVGPLVRLLGGHGLRGFRGQAHAALPGGRVRAHHGHCRRIHAQGPGQEEGGPPMKLWIAFWNILVKDMRAYYLKPPNVSWGILFPLAWASMFFIRSGRGLESVLAILPGITAVSVLFGTTSMLAVTIVFEKRYRSFERLLLAPLPLWLIMLAKTGGAILFGTANAMVPVAMAAFIADLSAMAWIPFLAAVLLLATSSTFLGLFIAVAVSEVFEAQTFSNFLRFPMIFLCGLFIPVAQLPAFLRPLSHALPLTYGVDACCTAPCTAAPSCPWPWIWACSACSAPRFSRPACGTSSASGLCRRILGNGARFSPLANRFFS